MEGGGWEQGQGQDEGGIRWRGGLEAPAFALHERGLALLDSRERVPLVHLGEQPGERAASRTRGTAEGVARAEEGPVDRQAERGVQLCPHRVACRAQHNRSLFDSIFEQVASFDHSGVETPESSLFVNGATSSLE